MPISFIFWLLMLLWLIGWLGGSFGPPPYNAYWNRFGMIFIFVLLCLLGLHDFGWFIRGG